MNRPTKAQGSHINEIAEDARALLIATADVAGHKVERARKRLAAALEHGKADGEAVGDITDVDGDTVKELQNRLALAMERGKARCDSIREDVVEKAKAADHSVRGHPYQAVGIALGVGALIGYIGALIGSHNGNGSRNGG